MEINKDNWKQIDLNVDSLWLIPERDRQGKYGHEIEMYTVEQGEKRDKRQ